MTLDLIINFLLYEEFYEIEIAKFKTQIIYINKKTKMKFFLRKLKLKIIDNIFMLVSNQKTKFEKSNVFKVFYVCLENDKAFPCHMSNDKTTENIEKKCLD